jgi:RNA polymerase sigma-70 factor (ECF subfamily)
MLPLVYAELHRLAAIYVASERGDHTLQPTALVHEAYLRLVDPRRVDWRNRAQWLGVAAVIMRRVWSTMLAIAPLKSEGVASSGCR